MGTELCQTKFNSELLETFLRMSLFVATMIKARERILIINITFRM